MGYFVRLCVWNVTGSDTKVHTVQDMLSGSILMEFYSNPRTVRVGEKWSNLRSIVSTAVLFKRYIMQLILALENSNILPVRYTYNL